MGFKVKDLEQKDLEYLSSIGFITHTGSPYMEFDNFSIILNPATKLGYGTIVICYLNEDVDSDYIEETVPLFELYDTTQKLIEQGIIYVESEEKQ